MFNIEPYKYPRHKKLRAPMLTMKELCMRLPEERSMPYFATPVADVEADVGYKNLTGVDKGTFLRLLFVIWKSNGLLQDYTRAIAAELEFTEEEWSSARATFIESGLLEMSPDGIYLLNREFRQQYLNTLKNTNARRNKITKSNLNNLAVPKVSGRLLVECDAPIFSDDEIPF